MEYQIVRMQSHHVEQIAQLEMCCFSDPWSVEAIEPELTNPLSYWLVAVKDDLVIGYVGTQSVLGEADMMNLAVHPGFRRQHVAQSLVQALEQQLQEQGVHCLTLEVRVSNEAAIVLYQKLGFSEIGIRKNYYFHPKEDAKILRKDFQV